MSDWSDRVQGRKVKPEKIGHVDKCGVWALALLTT